MGDRGTVTASQVQLIMQNCIQVGLGSETAAEAVQGARERGKRKWIERKWMGKDGRMVGWQWVVGGGRCQGQTHRAAEH